MKKGGEFFWALALVLLCSFLLVGCAQKEPAAEVEHDPEEHEHVATIPETVEDEDEVERPELKEEELRRMEELGLKEEDREEIEAAEIDLDLEEAKQELQNRIHFAFDSYELRSEARDTLREKAKILQNNNDLQLVIEGHCDERGTAEYNLALGERRARAAYEFLILLGVNPDRLKIISYGEERPLVPESNEEAWAQNRRAEFRVH